MFPGETVSINFNIQNQSEDQLSDCTFQVSSNYPNIQIVNGLEDIGFINGNEIVELEEISFSDTLNNLFSIKKSAHKEFRQRQMKCLRLLFYTIRG